MYFILLCTFSYSLLQKRLKKMKGRICDALVIMICKIESEARENINHSSRAVRARKKKLLTLLR